MAWHTSLATRRQVKMERTPLQEWVFSKPLVRLHYFHSPINSFAKTAAPQTLLLNGESKAAPTVDSKKLVGHQLRPTTKPATTERNATASSKQGQSSAGAGWTKTRKRVAGIMVTVTGEVWRVSSLSRKARRGRRTKPAQGEGERLDEVFEEPIAEPAKYAHDRADGDVHHGVL